MILMIGFLSQCPDPGSSTHLAGQSANQSVSAKADTLIVPARAQLRRNVVLPKL